MAGRRQCQRAFACTQYFAFMFFQFRGAVTFNGLECLAAHIFKRCFVGLRLADFDVIAVHAVVTEFKRRNPGAFALTQFQVDKILIRVLGDCPKGE